MTFSGQIVIFTAQFYLKISIYIYVNIGIYVNYKKVNYSQVNTKLLDIKEYSTLY